MAFLWCGSRGKQRPLIGGKQDSPPVLRSPASCFVLRASYLHFNPGTGEAAFGLGEGVKTIRISDRLRPAGVSRGSFDSFDSSLIIHFIAIRRASASYEAPSTKGRRKLPGFRLISVLCKGVPGRTSSSAKTPSPLPAFDQHPCRPGSMPAWLVSNTVIQSYFF